MCGFLAGECEKSVVECRPSQRQFLDGYTASPHEICDDAQVGGLVRCRD